MKRILVADDEESLRVVIRNTLRRRGYEVDCAREGREAADLLERHVYGVALLDIRMPGLDGFELLERIQRKGSGPAVIMMTAQDTMKNAIEAMKKGAFDYLAKPFDLEELEVLVDRAQREKELEREVERLREEVIKAPTTPQTFVGESRPMREIHKLVGRLAARDVTVLIQGESGTGKELIARMIHLESPRAKEPFVAVNIAAIPRELLESELFGHTKGAFTGAAEDRVGWFEKAGRGTLFLDEIGDLSPNLQVKILRALQEREIQRVGSTESIAVAARIIAATNQSLAKMVKEKRFREDLFYRLNVVPLEVPPLRARREDIPLLVDFFLKKFCEELALPLKRFDPKVMAALKKYAWPGNVRELENMVKRAVILSPGITIQPEAALSFLGEALGPTDVDDLALEEIVRKKLDSFLSKWDGYEVEDLHEAVLQRVERPLLELVLERTKGNQIRAAKMLGINRNTLRKKIRDLKIKPKG